MITPHLPDPRPKLRVERRRVVLLIGRGKTPEEAAISCGVHPERLRRWLNTPSFRRALHFERNTPMEVGHVTGPEEETNDAQ
jgi:hypothetical protein